MTAPPQTEIEKRRAGWWADHYRPEMSVSEVLRLNEELVMLFPMTSEERDQRAKEMEGVPEFVL